jgi:hypothetical protein
MPQESEMIHIHPTGTVDKDPHTLSKTGNGYPKQVWWVNDDRNNDRHIDFGGNSPFDAENIVAKKDGTPAGSGKIKDKALGRYPYAAKLPKETAKDFAADPEVIIRN